MQRGSDPILAELVRESLARGGAVAERQRLLQALRGFDEAAVFTIHGFCQRVLQDNAFESGDALRRRARQRRRTRSSTRWRRTSGRASSTRSTSIVVRYLRRSKTQSGRKLSPAKLARLARLAVAQPEMPVLSGVVEGDREAARQAWAKALGEVAELWRRRRDEIVALLTESESLKRNVYKPWRRSGRSWVAAARPRLGGR